MEKIPLGSSRKRGHGASLHPQSQQTKEKNMAENVALAASQADLDKLGKLVVVLSKAIAEQNARLRALEKADWTPTLKGKKAPVGAKKSK